jgi:biotin carboxyl carrier protein
VKGPAHPANALRYEAEIEGRTTSVEVEPRGEGLFRVRVGDRAFDLDARETEAGVYSVLVGNRALEVNVEEDGEAMRVELGGRAYELQLQDKRHRRHRRTGDGAHAADAGLVLAPMPGKVVKVLVAPGETVQAGQGVIVVEAMKMENELRAPRDGVVREVRASVSQAVEIREVLVVVG